MKNFLKIISIIAIAGMIYSCKKSYLQEINTDPNSPQEVPAKTLLPTTQVSIAFVQGGDASRYTSVFTQHVTGGSRQFQSYNRYIFSEEDFNNLWNNLYAGPMMDLSQLIKLSKSKGYKKYEGVAKIMMAYSLGMATDLFGDVPYAEAFRGLEDNLTPKFDSQQQIYNTIQQLLTEGKAALLDTMPGSKVPGSDDLMYGGDESAWIKFANALSARYFIHLVKADGAAATKALTAIGAGAFTGSADDAQLKFGTAETNSNPWYQYIWNRDDILYEGFLVDTMTALNDPRLAEYTNMYDDVASKFAAVDAPVALMTYYEQKFIEAEAHVRLNDAVAAQVAFTEAVTASMKKMGVADSSITTYLAANGILAGTQAQMLEKVMFQKYIAMYLHPEAWTDWRRTGIPALAPNTGAVISSIPRRFIYGTNERLYNPNCPQSSNLLSPRLWWDQ